MSNARVKVTYEVGIGEGNGIKGANEFTLDTDFETIGVDREVGLRLLAEEQLRKSLAVRFIEEVSASVAYVRFSYEASVTIRGEVELDDFNEGVKYDDIDSHEWQSWMQERAVDDISYELGRTFTHYAIDDLDIEVQEVTDEDGEDLTGA